MFDLFSFFGVSGLLARLQIHRPGCLAATNVSSFIAAKALHSGSGLSFDNPSTSYRIGKPTKCKNTPQHTKCGIPQNTPSDTPQNTPKIYENRILGVFFWYFRGIFSISWRGGGGKFGCRAGIFGLFWGLWGFLLCS